MAPDSESQSAVWKNWEGRTSLGLSWTHKAGRASPEGGTVAGSGGPTHCNPVREVPFILLRFLGPVEIQLWGFPF